MRTGANSYSLAAGTPDAVTAELEALVFTPTAGRASQPNTTTFTLTDASSAGTGASDATTTVTDTAAPADTAAFDTTVRYAGDGTFVLTGRATSSAGVSSVEISAVVDGGAVQDLGTATVDADGTFTFRDVVGAHDQAFITATVTDSLGGTASAQAAYSLVAGLRDGAVEAKQYVYDPDGTAVTTTRLFRAGGGANVNVQAPNQTFHSAFFDTWNNHNRADTTFVFNPGFGRDTIALFKLDGAGHDTLDFKGSDYGNSIATVLASARDTKAGLLIIDPVASSPGPGPGHHDTLLLKGITKDQLAQYRTTDIRFHA